MTVRAVAVGVVLTVGGLAFWGMMWALLTDPKTADDDWMSP